MGKTSRPKEIIELEKKLKIRLKCIEYRDEPFEYHDVNSYFTDDMQNTIGLNISGYRGSFEMNFLKDFIHLKHLSLNEMQISNLDYFPEFSFLTTLLLPTNEIFDISPLENLVSLIHLDLRNNKISDISYLSKMVNLEVLYLWNNQISDIESISNLKKLNSLDLGRNPISTITSLTNLQKITKLDIGSTRVTDIRPLEKIISTGIDLYNDQESYSETDTGLFIYENVYTIPPLEVIEQGNETILQYFQDAHQFGLKALNECKLIFLGDGELGKTSLMKKIIGLPFSKETTTHGINKKSWNDIKNNANESIKVNLWDFGGQHIQHLLHQFFLTEKVIYILLLNPRNDSSSMYWLEQIDKLGKDSEILIVYNWKDSKDRDSHNNKNFYELRKAYPQLKTPFLLSCKEGDGFDDFKKELVQLILNQKDLLVQYPLNWFKIKEELELDVTISKNYIAYNEYETICSNNRYDNDINKKNLLKQLDKIGSIVFFDKPILNELQVLNPDWITTGAYSVITSEITRTNKGHLNYKDLKDIFKDEKYLFANEKIKLKYKDRDFQFILALMTDYDLCVFNPFVENEYLIPCAFEGEKPIELEIYKINSRQYRFQFESAFEMLIMYRFMARNISKCIKDGYWQSGIVIKDLHSNTFASVETNQHSKIIDFWISGENIRGFWEALRSDIKDINSKYSLKFREEILYYDKDTNNEVFLSYNEMVNSLYNGVRIIEFHPVHQIFNLDVLNVLENFEDSKKILKSMEKSGINLNIKGDYISNGQTQIGGKNNSQTSYVNYYNANPKLQEIKDLLEDLEDLSKNNLEWQSNFTNALKELYRLEDATDPIDEKKSISKIQKFFVKAKEIKDWVAIGVLPAELATKGTKMIELGIDFFKFIF